MLQQLITTDEPLNTFESMCTQLLKIPLDTFILNTEAFESMKLAENMASMIVEQCTSASDKVILLVNQIATTLETCRKRYKMESSIAHEFAYITMKPETYPNERANHLTSINNLFNNSLSFAPAHANADNVLLLKSRLRKTVKSHLSTRMRACFRALPYARQQLLRTLDPTARIRQHHASACACA